MSKQIKIIGTGMGRSTLTAEALDYINSAEILIGAQRMIDMFKDLVKPVFVSYKSGEIAEFIAECDYNRIAVLMSGDCGFYSGAEKLSSMLKDCDTEIICGVSSIVYFSAKLKMPWHDMHIISLHGTDGNIVRSVSANKKVFFLLGGKITPADICRKLCEYDMQGIKVYIGENLSSENERINFGRAEEFISFNSDYLSVMITENDNAESYPESGIDDSRFIRGNVPMTKSEIRNSVISKLGIGKRSVVWDIGCGTGSVSIEAALRCTDGKVCAVDNNAEATELTDKNRHLFRCDNIEITNAEATDAVKDFPAPDSVFIGGSSGKLHELFSAAHEKNPTVRMVVTAVTLETLSGCVDEFGYFGVTPEIIQLAVTKIRKVGKSSMLSAENPVFVIWGNLK